MARAILKECPRPPSFQIRSCLGIAAGRVSVVVGLGAQRPKIGRGIRDAYEGYRSCVVLAIEGCRIVNIENAPVNIRVIRIVEPESYVECVDRIRIALIRIEAEDLIEQDRFDRGRKLTIAAGMKIRLVPSHPEVREI